MRGATANSNAVMGPGWYLGGTGKGKGVHKGKGVVSGVLLASAMVRVTQLLQKRCRRAHRVTLTGMAMGFHIGLWRPCGSGAT